MPNQESIIMKIIRIAQAKNEWELKLKDPSDISMIPDGEFKALNYGYTLELENGTIIKTKDGVRCSRERCGGYEDYSKKDNKIFKVF